LKVADRTTISDAAGKYSHQSCTGAQQHEGEYQLNLLNIRSAPIRPYFILAWRQATD